MRVVRFIGAAAVFFSGCVVDNPDYDPGYSVQPPPKRDMATKDQARRDLVTNDQSQRDLLLPIDLTNGDMALADLRGDISDLSYSDLVIAPDILACAAGFADCDGDPRTVCETNIETILNCGGCGMACSTNHAQPGCYMDTCGAACRTNYGDCDGDARINGCETNIGSDHLNCGACGKACPFGWLCESGKCSQTCRAPLILCGNRCTDPRTDDLHCGGCGNRCQAGESCANGVCWPPCPVGLTQCSNLCVNVLDDPSHCGGCGKACSLDHVVPPYCRNGACANECAQGWYDCNAGVGGCESQALCL